MSKQAKQVLNQLCADLFEVLGEPVGYGQAAEMFIEYLISEGAAAIVDLRIDAQAVAEANKAA